MDPLTGALIIGGVSAGAQLLTNQSNAKTAKETNEAQMAFQEKQSNTSYQRAKSDLLLAGMNPALAYSQGGASSSAGAGNMALAENPLEQLGASAKEVALLNKEGNKKDAEINLNKEMAKTQATQQALNANSAKAAAASAVASQAAANKAMSETNINVLKTPALKAEADLAEKEAKLREKTLYVDYGAEKVGQLLEAVTSGKNLMKKRKEIYIDKKTGEILK